MTTEQIKQYLVKRFPDVSAYTYSDGTVEIALDGNVFLVRSTEGKSFVQRVNTEWQETNDVCGTILDLSV